MSDNDTQNSVDVRLKETSSACLECYIAWQADKKNLKTAEALQNAVHELRKVASRLEIDLAISERDNAGQKPVLPPVHKTSRGNRSGADQDGNQGSENAPQKQNRQRRSRKQAAEG